MNRMVTTVFDHSALTDPALAEPRRELRPLQDLLDEGHKRHMQMRSQDAWLDAMLKHDTDQAAQIREKGIGPGMQRRKPASKTKVR